MINYFELRGYFLSNFKGSIKIKKKLEYCIL